MEISKCQSWEAVKALFMQNRSSMTTINIVALMMQLPKVAAK